MAPRPCHSLPPHSMVDEAFAPGRRAKTVTAFVRHGPSVMKFDWRYAPHRHPTSVLRPRLQTPGTASEMSTGDTWLGVTHLERLLILNPPPARSLVAREDTPGLPSSGDARLGSGLAATDSDTHRRHSLATAIAHSHGPVKTAWLPLASSPAGRDSCGLRLLVCSGSGSS